MEKINIKSKELCPKCKRGRESYLIDKKSIYCPYIFCHNGNNCAMYEEEKEDVSKEFK